MTAAKSGTNGRAATALDAVRQLWRDGSLDRAALAKLGVDTTADSLSLGDHRLIALVREAARAPRFGDAPIDEKIRTYVDGAFGVGRWQRDRDPWPWERGSDAELDRLWAEEDAEAVDWQARGAAMWTARDELAASYRRENVTVGILTAQMKALDAATEAWTKAQQRVELARGRRIDRQLLLQDRYRDQQRTT